MKAVERAVGFELEFQPDSYPDIKHTSGKTVHRHAQRRLPFERFATPESHFMPVYRFRSLAQSTPPLPSRFTGVCFSIASEVLQSHLNSPLDLGDAQGDAGRQDQ